MKFFTKFFREDAPSESDALDAKTATGALFMQLALADEVYTEAEAHIIRATLGEVFEVEGEALDALAARAETLAHEATDHHRFTRVVKDLELDTKKRLVEALWRISFADGKESPFEEPFVRRVGDLLHVPHRDVRLARRDVRDALDEA